MFDIQPHQNKKKKVLYKISSLQQRLCDLIDDSKQKYFSSLTHKLTTIQKSSKA